MADDLDEVLSVLERQDAESRQRLLADLFMQRRDELRAMVEVRLTPRLRRRIDPSDVLQESFLEASKRLDEFLKTRPMRLSLWFRFLTGQKLRDCYRRHLRAKARDARREVSIFGSSVPAVSSALLAEQLVAKGPSPSQEVMRAELRARIEAALEGMEPLDREILVLRHFEQLRNTDVAELLGLGVSAASKRYLRSLERLRQVLEKAPGAENGSPS